MYVLLILASNACCVYILTLMLLVASYIRVYHGGHMYVCLLLASNACDQGLSQDPSSLSLGQVVF